MIKEIISFSFGQYLDAIDGDLDKYLDNLFGEDKNVLFSYHMKIKKPEDLSKKYSICTDIDELPFGQFIGCENAITSGYSKKNALKVLSSFVLRPIDDKEFDNTDQEKELKNLESILEEDARSVKDILELFMENRFSYINEKYKGVFYAVKDENEKEEEKEQNEKSKDSLDKAEEDFKKSWYWYSMARNLAKDGLIYQKREGLSPIECVLMTKMSSVAPELAFKRKTQILEEARMKKDEMVRKAEENAKRY